MINLGIYFIPSGKFQQLIKQLNVKLCIQRENNPCKTKVLLYGRVYLWSIVYIVLTYAKQLITELLEEHLYRYAHHEYCTN